ncbi:hypothetical protein D1632_01830 [Chryseobacterium nematophagum]|uniref:C1q domain-containing protein n=1 Tax=Chryseobacterium nematophagum TaxID=2305228 RepID=A0A3M7LDB3_9FLAO|nr:hypothetical protein [Chryseobacterium nematophagum]RMZ60743.1 hypothetical protein D1632_01830 [Chryseobacterium nematophagum]
MGKYLTILLFMSNIAFCQVGINSENPSATLDIVSKGNTNSTKALEINNSSNTEIVTILDNGNMGIGINTPTTKVHIVGDGINSPLQVENTLPVIGPYSALAINDNTGQVGKFTPGSTPVFYFRSTYNNYSKVDYCYFELTNAGTIELNTLGVTIENGGTDGSNNTDYLIIPQAGIYRIDANFSYGVDSGLGSMVMIVTGTSHISPGSYDNLFTTYFQTPFNTNTQGANAFAIFKITEPSRIRLALHHSGTDPDLQIRRAIIPNPPTTTLNFVITKL